MSTLSLAARSRKRTYPKLEECTHISLDIETLGTKPGCKILSIGACVVGAKPADTFYVELNPDLQLGEVCQDTLTWWNSQPGGVAFVTRCYGEGHGAGALVKFAEWLEELAEPVRIWTQGQFDAPILGGQFDRFTYPEDTGVPWNYWELMDLRTARAMYPCIDIHRDLSKYPTHHALADAQYQALCITQVIREATLL